MASLTSTMDMYSLIMDLTFLDADVTSIVIPDLAGADDLFECGDGDCFRSSFIVILLVVSIRSCLPDESDDFLSIDPLLSGGVARFRSLLGVLLSRLVAFSRLLRGPPTLS